MIEVPSAKGPVAGTESALVSAAASKPRLHLTYLDGLRGLAALYVVIFHIYQKLLIFGSVWPFGYQLFLYGTFAVDVFIVLSGYCLMLPVVRSARADLSGGVGTFLTRRAWRILPPYYVALAISAGLLYGSQHVNFQGQAMTPARANDLSLGVVLSHLFLVHNLSSLWTYKIDAAMWSVATEWQIYFFLPALLLPLWKRWGNGAMLGCAWALGLLPWFLGWDFAVSSHSWLLGLFALGMGAASVNFPRHSQDRVKRLPWGIIAIGLIFCLFLTLFFTGLKLVGSWQLDLVVGMITSALLVYCTLYRMEPGTRRTPLVLHLLESRVCVGLGAFSYSLYLIHGPLLTVFLTLLHHHLDGDQLAVAMIGAGLPLSLGIGFLFFLLFEKPFLGIRTTMTKARGEVVL